MSTRPSCEVADVVRAHGKQFLQHYGSLLGPAHLRVLHAIQNCRTALLGGHVSACDSCGHRVISYNSCRNRHCPKCQAAARQQWLDRQATQLLPLPYFHVVFTLPQLLAPLALQNQRAAYAILFRAASETLLEIAADPKHLGAQTGFLAVLHTWGQSLQHHPHPHCLVPGGGLAPDHSRWVYSSATFLFPVKVLSRVFRGKFLACLRSAFRQGKLHFHGKLSHLGAKPAFDSLLRQAAGCEWVVYAKPPFAGPELVLRYLSRYTHRVAISNHRLVSIQNGNVAFRWKDYAHGGRQRKMTLPASEFLRRFFLHILPPGFVRIRSYGFLANRRRKKLLALCRSLLAAPPPPVAQALPNPVTQFPLCPACRAGRLHIVERTPPRFSTHFRFDSS